MTSTQEPVVHVFFLIHGSNGHPRDFDLLTQYLASQFPAAHIHASGANVGQTQKGIISCGQRLLEELQLVLRKLVLSIGEKEAQLNISFISHSLGGLLSRYVVGDFCPWVDQTFFSQRVQWTGFYTLCTPHLGSRRPKPPKKKAQKKSRRKSSPPCLDILTDEEEDELEIEKASSLSWRESMWKSVLRVGIHQILSSPKLYGETGKDLLLETEILEEMTEPKSKYIQNLARFMCPTLVALTDGDKCVPLASSAILASHVYTPLPLSSSKSVQWRFDYSGFCQNSVQQQVLEAHPLSSACASTSSAASPSPHVSSHRKTTTLTSDAKCDVEYFSAMVAHLQQSIAWRRLLLKVQCPSLSTKWKLHDWPLGKDQDPQSLVSCHMFIQLFLELMTLDQFPSVGDSSSTAPKTLTP